MGWETASSWWQFKGIFCWTNRLVSIQGFYNGRKSYKCLIISYLCITYYNLVTLRKLTIFIELLAVRYIDIETCQFGVIKTSGDVPVSVSIDVKVWCSVLGCWFYVWLRFSISYSKWLYWKFGFWNSIMAPMDPCSQPQLIMG